MSVLKVLYNTFHTVQHCLSFWC